MQQVLEEEGEEGEAEDITEEAEVLVLEAQEAPVSASQVAPSIQ